MYQYYHNRKYDLLIVQHFNDFIGAETTQAMVAITKLLPKKDLISLKYVIADFRKVSSSTLYDTDRALHTLLHSQFGALRSNLKFVRLYDKDNPATEILIERVTRTNDMIKLSIKSTITAFNVYHDREIPALLDLPQEVVIWADDQWLSPSR
ncbi:MAG: hypothetical protein HOL98_04710 [Gammaproteobacteria bacterium]|jgi:hypothetical protein|nr:hypothetical protein [Gammaproteobacteria bacterium]MBT5202738.1 hypothetical protein [Gammaproteobacteria bacterium]MBT5600776.1 hypothetical protein [Gammaproteobacteria bacterium]MBT6243992.1 hypothetical protein [Gammaproteobacteria bacterium]